MSFTAFVSSVGLSIATRPWSSSTPVSPGWRHLTQILHPIRSNRRCVLTCTAANSNENNTENEDDDSGDDVMQGPTQAPSEAGVSTAGLDEKETALLEAAYKADVPGIEEALKEDVDVNVSDVNGRTCLHFCAGNGLPTLVRDLVSRGAEMNKQDMLGYTPLHMAAGYKMVSTVRALVELGADANVASFDERLPVEIVEGLLERTPKKKFFRDNPEHEKLAEIVEVLDEATEVEDDDEEDGEEEDAATDLQAGEERVETVGDTKFVVRVQEKDEEPPQAAVQVPAEDVEVSVKIIEPEPKQ